MPRPLGQASPGVGVLNNYDGFHSGGIINVVRKNERVGRASEDSWRLNIHF